ncbi:MAG TPA: tetratricopeptide repeat protein [bacterium]|nr:tetratricopeptide repeat protein [bacterium]
MAVIFNSSPSFGLSAEELNSVISRAEKELYSGSPEKALGILMEIEKDAPGSAGLQKALGYSHEVAGNLEFALEHYEKASELDPGNDSYQVSIGIVLKKMSDFKSAIDHFNIAIMLNPESIPALNQLGRTYEAISDLTRAEDCYKSAISIDDSIAITHENLGNLYIKTDNFEAASESLLTAISLDPLSQNAYNNLSFALFRQKKYSESLDAINAGLEINRDSQILKNNKSFLVSELKTMGLLNEEELSALLESKTASEQPASSKKIDSQEHISLTSKPAVLPPLDFEQDSSQIIDLPPLESRLSPLPLPSIELGEMISKIGDSLDHESEFRPLELSEMRKKMPGMLVFEDGEHNLWRVRPAQSAPQKMFPGSQPVSHPTENKFAFIDWDLRTINLYVYDFDTSIRNKIYSTSNMISNLSFSPDGKKLAFMLISINSSKPVLYIADLDSKEITPIDRKMDFNNFTWDPSDNSIWLTFKNCPTTQEQSGLCYAHVVPEKPEIDLYDLTAKNISDDSMVPFNMMSEPRISFSPDGNLLLVYDNGSGSEIFYIIDMAAGYAEPHSFERENGKKFVPRNMQWGLDNSTFSMTIMGSIWVKIPETDFPFPAVIGHFVDSNVAWMR